VFIKRKWLLLELTDFGILLLNATKQHFG